MSHEDDISNENISNEKITEVLITEVLKTCFDPEIPVNIVDLGLIYGIEIKNGNVSIRMTLTVPSCPLSSFINEDIQRKVSAIKGVKKVDIEVIWDPPWSPDRMSKDARQVLGI